METHSSILAWTISWTEEPGGSQSMGSQPDLTEAAEHPHKTDNRDVLCSPGNYIQLFVIMEKNLKKHASISIHTHLPELLSVQLKLAQHCKLIILKMMVKKAEGPHSHKIPLGSRDCVVGDTMAMAPV